MTLTASQTLTAVASSCILWIGTGEKADEVCDNTKLTSNADEGPLVEVVGAAETRQTRESLKARALYYVSLHPHSDSEDVSEALGISPLQASNALRELLNEGLIGFAE